jgi:hypothetical protein
MWLLARTPAPRVIVDPNGSAVTDSAGVHSSADPTGRTWPEDVATVRFVPVDPYDLDAYDQLYRTIKARIFDGTWPACSVLCDEAETVMPANRCPRAASALVYSGRKWPTAHIACATRPKNISTSIFANVTHAALFPLPKKEDRDTVAGHLGIPLAVLDDLYAALPPNSKSFLWWTQETRSIRPVHSLPA